MRQHMETTMRNLEAGLGSWDTERRRSKSASFDYDPDTSRCAVETEVIEQLFPSDKLDHYKCDRAKSADLSLQGSKVYKLGLI